jgi:hypothetical protein
MQNLASERWSCRGVGCKYEEGYVGHQV